ncbi:sugar ABC transporter permease, partial [Bacillus cereus]
MNIKRQKMLRLSLSYLVIFVMCAIIFYPLLWIIG